MAAKGHPWLFVRFVVLSGRMVRRPLKYLQRPVRSWNLAAYTSVLYIIVSYEYIRFLYKGIIIKHNKTEPTYTKTSLFLCEKRRFFMARTEKGVVATI